MSWLLRLFGVERSLKWRQVDWMRLGGDWQMAKSLWQSPNQADKKQAVIQADSAFDRLLKEAEVPGVTMGERLKSISKLVDRSIYNRLWEAHKKRNELVHETSSFVAHWEKAEYISIYKEAARQLRFGR